MEEFNIPNLNKSFNYSIKKYDDNYYELVVRKFRNGFKDVTENNVNEKKLTNNLSRARTSIFELSMCNDFDYFVTLTLNPLNADAFDLDNFIKTFGQFIRNLRRKYKQDIQYLLVPEKHKSGAWHMHGLIKGIPKHQLFKNSNGYLDWSDYKKKFGYVSLSPVRSKVGVSKYITKYISKSFVDNADRKNKKLYYSSRGLKRPTIESKGEVLQSDINLFLALNPDNVFDGDYVVKKELTKKELEIMMSSHFLVSSPD